MTKHDDIEVPKLPNWLSVFCEQAISPPQVHNSGWASRNHDAARIALDVNRDNGFGDDYAVDLLGLLIDEVERLKAELAIE